MLNETLATRNDMVLGNRTDISTNVSDENGNNPAPNALAVASVRSNAAVLAMVRMRLPVYRQAEEGVLMRLIQRMTAPHLLPKFLLCLSHIFSELNPATQTLLVIATPSGFLSLVFHFLARMFDHIVIDYFWGMQVSVVTVAPTMVLLFMYLIRNATRLAPLVPSFNHLLSDGNVVL